MVGTLNGHDLMDRARAYAAKCPPAVQGANGSATLMTTLRLLRSRFVLDDEQLSQLAHEYSDRCDPPWTDREIEHALASISKTPSRSEPPQDRFPATAAPPPKIFRTADDAIADLERRHGPCRRRWAYHGQTGVVVGYVLRWDHAHGKDIRPVSLIGAGWVQRAMATPRLLYCLPEIEARSNETVYVPEGEPAADALRELGLLATTASGGAQAAAYTSWLALSGRDVVILPDPDEAGKKYLADARRKLAELERPPTSVKVLTLPGMTGKEDAVDFVQRRREDGKDDAEIRAEIEALVRETAIASEAPTTATPTPATPINRPIERFTIGDLMDAYPRMHEPIIDGLLRARETANIISVTKVGKSWLTYGLLLSIATGRQWLGTYPTTQGRVLLIDNELHRPTIASRIRTVAEAMGIMPADYREAIEVWPLRGNMRSIVTLGADLLTAQGFRVVVIDAKYRLTAAGAAENSNDDERAYYDLIDHYAEATGAAIVNVHHSTKGAQGDKRVTDVGAGGGSQSRAADTHIVLREHEDDGVLVLDAAVRSFAPVEPMAIRWEYPLWTAVDDVDTSRLRGRMTAQEERQRERDGEAIGSSASGKSWCTVPPQKKIRNTPCTLACAAADATA